MSNWHGETMANFKSKSNDALCYIIQDCRRAIAAMPENTKSGQYADEIHYAGMELVKRGQRYIPPTEA